MMMALRKYINVITIYFVISMTVVAASTIDWLKDLQSGRDVTLSDGVSVRIEKLNHTASPLSYISSHMLRINVSNVGGITVSKAEGKDGLNLGLFTADSIQRQARGEASVFRVFLPLVIGFKIAGSVLTTLVAVIVVSLKAFLASKLALLLTGGVALKKLWHDDTPVGALHYQHPVEHHPHLHDSYYNYPTASGHFDGDIGPSGYTVANSYETTHVTADSNISEQYGDKAASSLTNSVTGNVSGTSPAENSGIKRRVFKTKPPVAPVVTVHKIIRTQVH